MSSSISRVTLPSLEYVCRNAIRNNSIALQNSACLRADISSFAQCSEIMALSWTRCGRRGLSWTLKGIILSFWNIEILWKGAFKTHISEKCFGVGRCLFFLRGAHCSTTSILFIAMWMVNVPANRTPLCRLSHQDAFILPWMDRITYSRPLCFRGEEDQTSN